MPIELYPSIAKIKRNGVYENLPGFVPETGAVATQQMIATSESSATAQYVHNKGEYFRLNDTLYQAIVKINVGDAIVVGTNCEVAVIGNDLTHVANSIAAYELGIATSSHNTGDYFMVGETLYVATSDIQVGDTISTSTNCRLAVVGDELSELKTAITECEGNIQVLAKFHHDDLTWADIQRIVQNGVAPDWFAIGDQLEIGWNGNTLEWDVVSFDDVELQNGNIVPGMWLQSHYAMEGIQFDASEAIYIASSALPAGTYNFTIGTTWGSNCVAGKTYQFTTTKEIPVGGQIAVGKNNDWYTWGAPDVAPSNWRVHTFSSNADTTPLESNLTLIEGSGGTALGSVASNIKYGTSGMNNLQRAAYGYNRWSQSANRQYYNSSAASGAWWTPQNPFDRAPQQLASQAGFMAGFDSDFLAVLKPIKVVTALNTVSDTDIGTSEATYDTFFLPSLEQEYIVPQLAGVEGAYWQYWKERLGLDSPQAQGSDGANENHIRYAYNAKTSAQYCRLRSALRGNAANAWHVITSGSAGGYYATGASRGCPACVIC